MNTLTMEINYSKAICHKPLYLQANLCSLTKRQSRQVRRGGFLHLENSEQLTVGGLHLETSAVRRLNYRVTILLRQIATHLVSP